MPAQGDNMHGEAMCRRVFLASAAALTATSLVPALAAAGDPVDDALKRITKARATIKTLQADFRQKRLIGLLATAVNSKGRLTLVRPDRLRWDLLPPDDVTYWIGPEGLALRNEDGVSKVGAASAGRFAGVLSDLLVMLGGDLSKLRGRYALSVEEDDKGLTLTAKPTHKDVKKHVSKLRMRAGKTLWAVERIEIHEKNGDRSLIDFSAFTRDKAVEASFMKPGSK